MTPTLINLTPHAITIPARAMLTPDATEMGDWTLPPSGSICRAAEIVTTAAPIAGIPTSRVAYGTLDGLPAPTYITLPHPCAGVPDDGMTCPVCGASSGHHPAPTAPAVYYVISSIAAAAARASGRVVEDLLVPVQPVRDTEGRVVGCLSLARV